MNMNLCCKSKRKVMHQEAVDARNSNSMTPPPPDTPPKQSNNNINRRNNCNGLCNSLSMQQDYHKMNEPPPSNGAVGIDDGSKTTANVLVHFECEADPHALIPPRETCGTCKKRRADGDVDFFGSCAACEKLTCKSCSSSYFDCEYCERVLCGDCVPIVPCEGSNECGLSNCMECAENGNGDVLYCTHCGRGFCTNCKSMEYCYCLEGDVCPSCHSEMHDYDVECYWRHLPSELRGIVDDFVEKWSENTNSVDNGQLAGFWGECIPFQPPDEDFDLRLYRRTRRARAASLILAAYNLLKGKEKEAIYMILYAALLEEVWNRGASYIKTIFERGGEGNGERPSAKILSIYFTSFHSVVENTTTKANIIGLLHNQLPSIREKEGKKLFQCIDVSLGKKQEGQQQGGGRTSTSKLIHSVPAISKEDYEEELSSDQYHYGDSLSMNIITSRKINTDNKQKNFVYKDMTLGWWLNVYVIKCMYHRWLTSPVTPSTEYFRVVHQGRTIFLRSAGTKTLHQLGIEDGDEIVVEGIEAVENIVPELNPGDIIDVCDICDVEKRDGDSASATFDTCNACEKTACNGCSTSFFDCEYCERLMCGECVTNVPCEGYNCDLANCMECAENGDGDVLFCTNCGHGFCTDCQSMEFCFCLVGDTCHECHGEMHDYDVEYYWQHLPGGMQKIIAEFAVDICEVSLEGFWGECAVFLPQDRDFDIRAHRKNRQARAASLILASYHVLKGYDKEGFYLILYAALLDEVYNRGGNYIRKIFEEENCSPDVLASVFMLFHYVVVSTETTAKMIAFLHNQGSSIHENEGKELFKCMDFALGKVQKSNTPIHSVVLCPKEVHLQDLGFEDHYDSHSMKMHIITSNMDDGKQSERIAYRDMSLSWWLKIYVIKCSYEEWLRNPEIPPSTKYFRVVHQGKTIFLSSAGKKTLQQLGIKEGDEIVVGGVEPEEEGSRSQEKKAKGKKDAKKKNKKSGGGKKKKKSKPPPAPPSLTEEQLTEKDRQEHSKTMTPVFEEIGPLLKDIRNRLNDLTIKKSAPKVRRRKSPKKKSDLLAAASSSMSLPPEDHLGGKAGRIAYPILVGEVSNLYKTSKSLGVPTITADLHGFTKDEALTNLDERLPVWVDTAMKGEYPWVKPVDIICGGGNQILSEVVQHWIRRNHQVANRPKGFV